MIYAVVNSKGGVGKTTTSVHLSTMLARNGKILLVDGDPQASAASWAAWRREAGYGPSPMTVALSGKAIFEEGRNLASSYDHMVIDAGGRDSSGMRSALLLAGVAVVPLGASNLDAAAMDDLLAVVEEAKQFNEWLDVRLLLARIDPRTKDVCEMMSYLEGKGLNVLKNRICERVAIRRAVGCGATVQEKGGDVNAVAEMEAFFVEVTE